MNLMSLKRFFMKTLIGCLVAAGILAVTTVLTGSFNDTFEKSLVTIMLVAVHALVSFGYIDISQRTEDSQEPNSAADLSFFRNTTFVIIVLSFLTSVLGLWGVLEGGFVGKLYLMYFVLEFAVLHGEVLSKMIGPDSRINLIVKVNYVFMAIVVIMLMPVIFASDASDLGDFYYRLLAAFGIVDTILTLVAIILNKLYLQKHPKVESALFNAPAAAGNAQAATPPKRGVNIFVIILIGFLGIQLVSSLIFAVIGSRAADNARDVQITQPNVNSSSQENSNLYSQEYDFTDVNNFAYSCAAPVTGTWHRRSQNGYSPTDTVGEFYFVPRNTRDLNEALCKPAVSNPPATR